MQLIAPIALLAALAAASPTLVARQSPARATIVSVAIRGGDGCPAGTFTTALSENSETGTVTFTAFNASVPEAPGSGSHDRQCTVDWRIRFPVGCTSLTMTNAYAGRATGAVGGAVNEQFRRSYSVSPSSNPPFTGLNPSPKADITPAQWDQNDPISNTLTVTDPNQQIYTLSSVLTLDLQPGTATPGGSVTLDSYTFSTALQIPCN